MRDVIGQLDQSRASIHSQQFSPFVFPSVYFPISFSGLSVCLSIAHLIPIYAAGVVWFLSHLYFIAFSFYLFTKTESKTVCGSAGNCNQELPTRSSAIAEGPRVALVSRFSRVPTCDRPTDGHTTTAYTTQAWCRAVKTVNAANN